jgi:hypothetical protein
MKSTLLKRNSPYLYLFVYPRCPNPLLDLGFSALTEDGKLANSSKRGKHDQIPGTHASSSANRIPVS